MEKKRTWICYYINSKGDHRQKVFDDMEEGLAFTQLLDKRIERGTCGGYSFMELQKGAIMLTLYFVLCIVPTLIAFIDEYYCGHY